MQMNVVEFCDYRVPLVIFMAWTINEYPDMQTSFQVEESQ